MMFVISGAASRLGQLVAERGIRSVPESDATERASQRTEDHLIDRALADSFPASDAPPWTLGVARSE